MESSINKVLKTSALRLAQNEAYRQANIEKIKARRKLHYEANKERIIKHNVEYEKNNKEYITNRKKAKRQAYRAENPLPVNRGSYNITLAERHREEWTQENLTVYYIKMIEEDGTIFYKYGLSKTVKNRMHKIPYSIEIIKTIELTKYDAIYLEHFLLKDKVQYTPVNTFKGYTECFI